MSTKWRFFSKELGKLFHFWIFGVFLFFLYRVSFIFIFRAEIQDALPFNEYLKVFFTGFRSDTITIGYFLLIPFALLLLLSPFGCQKLISSIRRGVEIIFLALSVTICLTSLNYYNEFHVNFDNNLYLGLFEEDLATIFKMLLQQENSVMFILAYIALLLVVFLTFKAISKNRSIENMSMKISKPWMRVSFILVTIFLCVSSMRGSLSMVNFRERNSAVSKVYMLNRSVLNPYKSLEISYKSYRERNKMATNNPYEEPLGQNSMESFQTAIKSIERTVDAPVIKKPKQVFLVIMESYDAWSLNEKYRPFNVSNNLARIADNGTSFTNFLPTYNATIFAYATIMTSIPYFGVNLAQVESSDMNGVDSSIFKEFEKMGYKTNLFYGGFLSWQKIEDYSLNLSCDHIYSAADIGGNLDNDCWGVEDEELFDLVLDKVSIDEYSFNVILTTSFHNPFPIDVWSKGFPYKTEEDLPKEMQEYFDGTISVKELGHRWYGDMAIGRFMDASEKKYSDALYAYTGDHYARKFINANPTLYEKSLVPFILYGKDIPAQQLDTPGSHMDILSTLVELVAPAGFTYSSFGSSMLNPDKKMGIAYEKIVTADHIFAKVDENTVEKVYRETQQSVMIDILPYGAEYKQIMGLAWYYVAKGRKPIVKI